METYIVSIPITTDMDSSQLLDIINSQISQILSDEIESYGYEVEVDENEVAVENVNEQILSTGHHSGPSHYVLVGRAKFSTGWLFYLYIMYLAPAYTRGVIVKNWCRD